MDQFLQLLDGDSPLAKEYTLESTILSLLLAFALGQAVAWVYYATHSGLSYSRSFVQSLILITVVVALVMSAIANSLITAIGLMGALAIIRFRNMLKDTRDIAFIFGALVAGMTVGAQRYTTAIIGTAFLILCVLYLHLTNFGAHQPHNGFLQFRLGDSAALESRVATILKRFCSSFTLLSVQHDMAVGPGLYAYQLLIRDVTQNERMLAELENVAGIAEVNLTMQEQLLEV